MLVQGNRKIKIIANCNIKKKKIRAIIHLMTVISNAISRISDLKLLCSKLVKCKTYLLVESGPIFSLEIIIRQTRIYYLI